MKPKELEGVIKTAIMIHKNRNVARILFSIRSDPKSINEISRLCDIPATRCRRTIKTLKEMGLLKVSRGVPSDSASKRTCNMYLAIFDSNFVECENGRFHFMLPRQKVLHEGRKVDWKTFIESCT